MKVHELRVFNHRQGAEFPVQTRFMKDELDVILKTYSQMVAAGHWRDYGISHLPRAAVFSVFRHAAEHPLYCIEKQPHLRKQQAMYQIVGLDGRIFRRGNDLRQVMRFFERKLLRIAS